MMSASSLVAPGLLPGDGEVEGEAVSDSFTSWESVRTNVLPSAVQAGQHASPGGSRVTRGRCLLRMLILRAARVLQGA